MKIGYSRISDSSQNITSQVDLLKNYGCDVIHEEVVSGIKEVKKLNTIIEEMKENDVLVVARVDRLGRSTRQIIQLVEELNKKGSDLVILDLNVDTRSPGGKMVLSIMAAVAEYERTINLEKQRNGIESARKAGKNLGRKANWTKEAMQEAILHYENNTKSINDIERIYKIPRSTFYRELRFYRQKL